MNMRRAIYVMCGFYLVQKKQPPKLYIIDENRPCTDRYNTWQSHARKVLSIKSLNVWVQAIDRPTFKYPLDQKSEHKDKTIQMI